MDILVVMVGVYLDKKKKYCDFLLALESVQPHIVVGISHHEIGFQEGADMRGVDLGSAQRKLP